MQQLTVVFSSGQSRNGRVILISHKSVRAVHYGTQLVVGWMIRIWKWIIMRRRRRIGGGRSTSWHNDLTTADPPSDPVSMMLFSSIRTFTRPSIHRLCCWLVEWTETYRLNVSEMWSSGCCAAVEIRRHYKRTQQRGLRWSDLIWWCDFEWIMDTRANNGCPFHSYLGYHASAVAVDPQTNWLCSWQKEIFSPSPSLAFSSGPCLWPKVFS